MPDGSAPSAPSDKYQRDADFAHDRAVTLMEARVSAGADLPAVIAGVVSAAVTMIFCNLPGEPSVKHMLGMVAAVANKRAELLVETYEKIKRESDDQEKPADGDEASIGA